MMNIMLHQKILFSLMLCAMAAVAHAQLPEPDKSPLDVSYAPHNFPILKIQGKNTMPYPLARVIYSRPQRNGRNLFGHEIRYNEIWRLGANEATELELFRQANIGGKNIPKGRYTLYCVPEPDKWTIVINKDNYSWGSFNYKNSNDVARVTIPITRSASAPVEYFTMYFNESHHLVILWDDVRATLPISFNLPR